ncbi:MAG: hypothetical protein IIY29_02025 [Firmicutes bacterium]|nr:hypothetical protein [Bacillota bacterium]
MGTDYKKLSRRELEDIVAAQEKEINELKNALEAASAQLQSRAIDIEETGSLAEASVRISGVFEAAQNAAERFLENIRLRQEETDRACEERDSESREKAIELLESTEAKCRALEEETKQKCAEMAEAAKQEADSYWREVSEKMEHFYQEHEGLKEMLDIPEKKLGE